jgi:hypothetical protein
VYVNLRFTDSCNIFAYLVYVSVCIYQLVNQISCY